MVDLHYKGLHETEGLLFVRFKDYFHLIYSLEGHCISSVSLIVMIGLSQNMAEFFWFSFRTLEREPLNKHKSRMLCLFQWFECIYRCQRFQPAKIPVIEILSNGIYIWSSSENWTNRFHPISGWLVFLVNPGMIFIKVNRHDKTHEPVLELKSLLFFEKINNLLEKENKALQKDLRWIHDQSDNQPTDLFWFMPLQTQKLKSRFWNRREMAEARKVNYEYTTATGLYG